MLRMLIDPNKAMVRSLPRDERDLMIQASNSWVCAYDNISGMRRWVSDALCCLATGGGFGTRKLHTDDDEMLFDVKRPVMLNGIEEDATKEDLLDRTIQVTLAVISEEMRMTEEDVWGAFNDVAPEILGSLLDAASSALQNVGNVKLDRLPRMADFAKWVVAAEPALGWAPGTFIAAYTGNRAMSDEAAMDQSAIGAAVVLLLDHCETGQWSGTAGELLDALKHHADDATKQRDDWPRSAPKCAAQLRRLAPVLRRNGIDYVKGDRTNSRRPITLTQIKKGCAKTVTTVTPSPDLSFFDEKSASS
jgi:putative DNA primase/helicase